MEFPVLSGVMPYHTAVGDKCQIPAYRDETLICLSRHERVYAAQHAAPADTLRSLRSLRVRLSGRSLGRFR